MGVGSASGQGVGLGLRVVRAAVDRCHVSQEDRKSQQDTVCTAAHSACTAFRVSALLPAHHGGEVNRKHAQPWTDVVVIDVTIAPRPAHSIVIPHRSVSARSWWGS